MTNLERARLFYILPRITTQDRIDLIAMFHPDVRYIGVDKESARGSDAIERLFQKYEDSGHGVTDVKFDIRHIAENGDCVLVDMIDSFLIDGKPHSGVWSIVFEFDDEGLITFWQEPATSPSPKAIRTIPPVSRPSLSSGAVLHIGALV
jgi:limonene-1,2-epoxide hydrolase